MAIKANIIDGIYIRVAGEVGRTNGLPFPVLVKMLDHLQEIIKLLAKYDLDVEGSPNLEQFEIELFDYQSGSAVPAIRLRQAAGRGDMFMYINDHKISVAKKFDELLKYSNDSEYEKFFPPGILPEVREDIAEEIHGFTLSAGNSPISIVKPGLNKNTFLPIYDIKRFTKDQADLLLRKKRRRAIGIEPKEMFALVQKVGNRKRIIDLYENQDAVLSIAPTEIVLNKRTYVLHSPLSSSVIKEDDHYVIQNEMLDLYASGESIASAEHDFYSEFDSSYKLLQGIEDDKLSPRLLRAKIMMQNFIKEIIISD